MVPRGRRGVNAGGAGVDGRGRPAHARSCRTRAVVWPACACVAGMRTRAVHTPAASHTRRHARITHASCSGACAWAGSGCAPEASSVPVVLAARSSTILGVPAVPGRQQVMAERGAGAVESGGRPASVPVGQPGGSGVTSTTDRPAVPGHDRAWQARWLADRRSRAEQEDGHAGLAAPQARPTWQTATRTAKAGGRPACRGGRHVGGAGARVRHSRLVRPTRSAFSGLGSDRWEGVALEEHGEILRLSTQPFMSITE